MRRAITIKSVLVALLGFGAVPMCGSCLHVTPAQAQAEWQLQHGKLVWPVSTSEEDRRQYDDPLSLLWPYLQNKQDEPQQSRKSRTGAPLRADAPLKVSIASVVEPDGRRVLEQLGQVVHFDVVIQNVSNRPQKIWAEDCSEGFSTVSLKVLAIDGKTLLSPIIVSRFQGIWGNNYVRGVTIEPGGVAVRGVYLSPPGTEAKTRDFTPLTGADTSKPFRFPIVSNGIYYTGLPRTGENFATHIYRMQAVFEQPSYGGMKPPEVWGGYIVSAPEDYIVGGLDSGS